MVRRRSLLTGLIGVLVAPTAVLTNNKLRGMIPNYVHVDESPFLPKNKTNFVPNTTPLNKQPYFHDTEVYYMYRPNAKPPSLVHYDPHA